ncbi:MAG: hypothetical protein EXR18_04240 [Flavobacteriaceae bacterium]|nr:hypothetical protein [Flavobacteriaceae bacterium]
MLYRIRTYLQFLWNSKNEHGVHSPFVFLLVTHCFYDKTKLNPYLPNLETNTKKVRFINRLFHYFQFQDGIYISENKKSHPSKVDFIFIDIAYLIKNNIELDEIIALANNETCIIFENPHYSKENETKWKSVFTNPNFKVTIDTYWYGLAFIRKQQVKEHFIIRV